MSQSSGVTIKYDCPFDLEAIFTVSVNMDNLKGILEFILERLHRCNLGLKDLDTGLKQ